jgi:uncharacterized repeat protein (TIGR01451 family)/MYXO-CTERM domain-containing protein
MSGGWSPIASPGRVALVGLMLRSAGTALGLLFVALLTAAAASAQTADLAITPTAEPNPVSAGGTVNVAITVTNNGPSAANNVAMVYLFPPDTDPIGTGSTPAGWTCGLGFITLQCTTPSLAAGASANFNPTFRPVGQTPAGLVLVGHAIITSTTVDPNPANNLARTNTTVTGGSPMSLRDLAVTMTGPPTVEPGQPIPYTITVTNNGPQTAFNVSMSDATPPDTAFVSLVAPGGWSCGRPPVGGVGLVECLLPSAFGSLASGASAAFTLTVQAQAATPSGTTITNVGTVDQSVSGTVDPTLTNNHATLNTLIQNFTVPPTTTVTATATSTPTATPTRLAGDFNEDGFVDIRDYGVWRQNFGQTNCNNPADADGNCLVDIRDYGIWRQHFGEGTSSDRRPGAALPTGFTPAPGGTQAPALLASDQDVAGSWAPQEPGGSGPAVPVIPLVGGLVGLGGLAGWRRRQPPRT